MKKRDLFLIALRNFAETQHPKDFVSKSLPRHAVRLNSVRIMRNYIASPLTEKGVKNG